VLGRSAGISDEKLAHLGDQPLPTGVYDDEEAVIVRYAQTSTLLRPIDDELYAELSRYFELREIMELWLIVAMANATNRFHATFLTPLDQRTTDRLAGSAGPGVAG
jgi:alkylhydroperoxidase family enzyme